MAWHQKFSGKGIPEYLARHYWWAYLWPKSIWFFDHQFIINAILFGQYNTLLRQTLAQVENRPGAKLLQLTCVYGKLTPSLLRHSDNEVHLCDVAEAQLALARRKTQAFSGRWLPARMNAEALGYADCAFDQVIVFFLFHELPPESRRRVYDEIARVVKPGGSVLMTEYAAQPSRHPLYRWKISRWILGRLEPFLPGFWNENIVAELTRALRKHQKNTKAAPDVSHCFSGFYRVMRFDIGEAVP